MPEAKDVVCEMVRATGLIVKRRLLEDPFRLKCR
jgi:hypothetical protein